MRTRITGRRLGWRLQALAGLVVALGLLAGAGGRVWADTPAVGTAQPVSSTYELYAAACPTATFCLAVGDDISTGVLVPVTVSGSTLTAGTAQPVSGALYGITCLSATLCLAVGTDGSGIVVPLTVSGSTVAAGTAQEVAGSEALGAVACPSATLCVAAGSPSGVAPALVVPVTVSGTTVTAGTAQTVTGTSTLNGVACPSATLCLATGNSISGVVVPLTVSGSTVTAGAPQTASGTFVLNGTVCPSATLCLAVGTTHGSAVGALVPVAVSGSTVTPDTSQVVGGTYDLVAVACPSATLCLAAGEGSSYAGVVVPLTVSGDAVTAGAAQTVSGTDILAGVACPTATLCLAVGQNAEAVSSGVLVPIFASGAAGTTTRLTATQNPSQAGQPVTFTASVSCPLSPDGGTVEFEDTSTSPPTTLGSAPVSGGVAVFKTSSLSDGAHTIVAVYGGNGACNGSTSNALQRQVLAPQGGVTLSSSRNPSNLDQAVTFTATASCFTAGETVTFLDGQTSIGTGTLNASGVAKLTTSSLSGGRHSITASYPGDGHCSAAMSASLTQTVNGWRTLG